MQEEAQAASGAGALRLSALRAQAGEGPGCQGIFQQRWQQLLDAMSEDKVRESRAGAKSLGVKELAAVLAAPDRVFIWGRECVAPLAQAHSALLCAGHVFTGT